MKKINQLCITSGALIAAEYIFSLVLKSAATASEVIIGEEGTQSAVKYIPSSGGIMFFIIMIASAVLLNRSFKSYAKGNALKWLLYIAVWFINSLVALQSVVKISTMEMFSYENRALRILQFLCIAFSVLSCFIIRGSKIEE